MVGRDISFSVSLLTSQTLQSCEYQRFLEEQGVTTLPVQQQMFRVLSSGERRQFSACSALRSSIGKHAAHKEIKV